MVKSSLSSLGSDDSKVTFLLLLGILHMAGTEVRNRKLLISVTVIVLISVVTYLNTALVSKISPGLHGKIVSEDNVDSIVADAQISSPEALAGALIWTRKREKELLSHLNTSLIEAAELRENVTKLEALLEEIPAGPPTVETSKWPSQASVCKGKGSSFKPITSTDGYFEHEKWQGPRLDGIEQTHKIAEKFAVSYCMNADKMSGFFRIEKKFDCDESAHFSDDPSYTSYVRTNLGPDDFSFSLEGPEIHALNPSFSMKYIGQCRYEMPYAVTIPGKYRLNLVWWRENYNGARENQPIWLPLHYDAPIGDAVHIYLGSEEADPQRERARTLDLLRKARDGAGLPDCDVRDPQDLHRAGRWIFDGDDIDNIFRPGGPVPLHGSPHATVEERGVPALAWVDTSRFVWQPLRCRLRQFPPAAALACLTSRSVVLQGDSQVRQLRNAIYHYVCDGVVLGIMTAGCGAATCGKPGLDRLCVEADGQAHGPTFMVRTDADLNLANFGQHFADGERQRKFAEYKARVDTLVEVLGRIDPAVRRARLAWYECIAQPLSKGAWIRGYGDQRTSVRMRAYNEYVNGRMRELGVPVVPWFELTAAWAVSASDNAHYEFPIVQRGSAQYLYNLLCPANATAAH